MSSGLEDELKQMIIDTLSLEDLSVAEFNSQEALFGGGYELDSIDALELGLAIRKKYDVKIDAETDDVETIFASVSHLAAFIYSKQLDAKRV
jgi:acyl carrier protein